MPPHLAEQMRYALAMGEGTEVRGRLPAVARMTRAQAHAARRRTRSSCSAARSSAWTRASRPCRPGRRPTTTPRWRACSTPWRPGSRTTTPTSIRSTPGRCSSRRTRWRGSPTRWRCGSIPTTTRSTAAAPARRWRRRRSPRSRAMFGWDTHLGHLCGGGTMANLEALWVAGSLHPGDAVAGLDAGALHARPHQRRARAAVRGDRRATRAAGMDVGGARARGSRAATSARWSRRSARRRSAPSIRCPEILRSARALSASASTSTPPTAATSGWPTTSAPEARAVLRPASARPTRSSSIRTSTGSSPTAAAACSSAIRRSGRFYQHDSPYTYFSSGGAAPRRDQPRVLAARRRRGGAVGDAASCCRSCAAARSRAGLEAGRAAALALYAGFDARSALRHRLPAGARHRRVGGARARVSEASEPARQIFDEAARARPAPGARGAARSRSSTRTGGHGARPRDGHLPALGADEARARRLARSHLGAARPLDGGRSGLKWRPPRVPVGGALVGRRDPQDRRFVERPPRDLEPDRQAGAVEAGRQ